MLPSLYVNYMQERNYASVEQLQKSYMKKGNYQNLEVNNPTGTVTVEIPLTGDTIYLVNKFIKVTVNVKNQKLLELLDKMRYYAKNTDEIKNISLKEFDPEGIMKDLVTDIKLPENYPLKFNVEFYKNENAFRQLSSKIHMVSDDIVIFESNITDGNNYYTSYIASGITDKAIEITLVSVMSPRIEEISPVIVQSLPMIIAVALLLVIISSQIFSRLIINPVIRLANHAEYMKDAKNLKLEPILVIGHDEISSLGESLNGLYQRIQESYQELEDKNLMLAEENERREVFLRASSHQLKTPLTAALLLVQGMMNEVGKYKDIKEYLPQVKQQLQSMQKIVEDILYLNHCSQNLNPEPVELSEVLEECKSFYHVQLEERALQVESEGKSLTVITDRELLKKILDNLLSNAVNFTPQGGRIKIVFDHRGLSITNFGITIDEELLPHVFDPFVTSITNNKGHGLGLYVVAYYAKVLNYRIQLNNAEDGGVTAALICI